MKRVLLCVLCLALLLSGCTQTGASPSTATFAGLTREEYKLSKDSEGVFCQVKFPGMITAFSLVQSSNFPWSDHEEFPGLIMGNPW